MSSRQNIRLHIDRLVLDGIPIGAADRPRLQAAIERELTRLIREGGLAPELAYGVAVPSLQSAQITLAADAKPAQLGSAIAGSLYGGLGVTR